MAGQEKPQDEKDRDHAEGSDSEKQDKSKSSGDSDGGKDGDKNDKEEDEGPPFYKKPLFWIIFTIVTAALIIGGILWWLHARHFESTDDAFVDAHIVRIAAQSSGRLTQAADADNRHVAKGQLLAVIEPGTPAASRQEALAGVAQADAQIKQAQAKVYSAIATERQRRADALAPQANAEKAAQDYQRYLNLRRIDALAAAPTKVDEARADAQGTAAQALAAKRQISSASADVLAARKEVESARAQRNAALARLQQADVTVSYLRIAAPIDGQVVNRNVDVGSYVSPGQQLMAIVPDQLWITANFKETQLTYMRPGQHVDIKIDAYPGVKFPGHVDSIQHGAGQAFQLLPAQNATGNYVKVVQRVPVRILFDGDDWKRYAIGPGMSAIPRVTVR